MVLHNSTCHTALGENPTSFWRYQKWRLSSSKLTWLAGKSRFLKGDTNSKCLFCHCHVSFQGFCIYLIHGGVSPYISLTSYSFHMWGFLYVRYLKFLMIRCWWMDALVGTVVLPCVLGKGQLRLFWRWQNMFNFNACLLICLLYMIYMRIYVLHIQKLFIWS